MSKKNTVWIAFGIASGLTDYCVEGVFSTQRKANKYIDAVKNQPINGLKLHCFEYTIDGKMEALQSDRK